MTSLRERKKAKTLEHLHKTAMRLFAEKGYVATTVADIAAAAEVSRATFFSYFPTKEDVIFGDTPGALHALEQLLTANAGKGTVVEHVQAWLRTLTGWFDEDLPLQLELARTVPTVEARRLQIRHEVEQIIVKALARDLQSSATDLLPHVVAGALISAVGSVEQLAAEQIERTGRPPSAPEISRLLQPAVVFITAGLESIPRSA